MSGTTRLVAYESLGSVIPGLGIAAAAVKVSGAVALSEIQAKLAGLLNVQAALTLPPLPTAAITGAANALFALQLNPSLAAPSLQISAIAAVIVELKAQLLSIQASLSLDFGLGAPGIAVYEYDGTTNTLGSSLAGATAGGLPGGGPLDHCNALILATSIPSTWAAMSAVLGV